jgi:aldehyde:ferredoxin oxidoreductase
MNNLLTVDLTTRSYHPEPIPEDVLDDFLGGRGLGAYLLYKNMQKGIDPLSPENVLIFSSGPAQGTDTYYASRGVVNTKSPLTNIYLFSVASGRFGHDIKKAGYTAVIVRGRSEAPTYLIINDGEVEFRSAKPLAQKEFRFLKGEKPILKILIRHSRGHHLMPDEGQRPPHQGFCQIYFVAVHPKRAGSFQRCFRGP